MVKVGSAIVQSFSGYASAGSDPQGRRSVLRNTGAGGGMSPRPTADPRAVLRVAGKYPDVPYFASRM